MSIIKICLIGGTGRMGIILKKKILLNKNFKLINSYSKNNNDEKHLRNNIKKSNIIIDFSRPITSIAATKMAVLLKKKIIIGTTGFSNEQESFIKKASKKIAIFKSGNMSLGINLLEYIVNILSKKIPNDYHIGINDDHHKKKVDYPSGTALMLANAVCKGKNKDFDLIKGKTFLNKKGNLQKNKINFFITRKGNTIGKHSVLFNNKIENIELKHTAFSRELFADGALNAVSWINKKNKGLFNMQDMFDLK